MEVGPAGGFVAAGLKREHWTTAEPIRRIFRKAFERAGLPYFNPHAIRDTLSQLGQQLTRTHEEFKAWSQNLGHQGMLVTLSSYGPITSPRQATLIRALAGVQLHVPGEVTVEQRLAHLEAALARGGVGPGG